MCVTPEIIVQIKQTFEIDGKPVAALPPIPKSFDDSLLSTYDAAERLAISPETLRRMCRRRQSRLSRSGVNTASRKGILKSMWRAVGTVESHQCDRFGTGR